MHRWRRDGQWRSAHRRWRHSVRWRLVTLFLVLALCMTAIFLFGMKHVLSAGWQNWARPLVADYLDRMAADIGSPPSPDKALDLARRLPVTVRIEGPSVNFDTQSALGQVPRRRYGPEGMAEHWIFTRATADGHRIVFGLSSPPDPDHPRRVGWFTLAAMLAITALAYGVVHRLLQPLQAIGAGVARFGRGEFEPPIAMRRNDELGDLAARVDGMAANLKTMLDAKRALLLAISHELRSPLTRARLNAELVDEGEHKAALLRDLSEMRDLITALMESERIAAGHQALQIESVDLAALAREVAATFAEARLELELDEALPPQPADPMRLKLLLRNLIDNALRHGDNALRHGGHEALPPRVFLRREADGRLALGVRDQGPGVADEHLARLAEAFYRPDTARTRASGGVGLGLYLCRLVAQAHGGELRLAHAQPGLEVAMVWRADALSVPPPRP